MHVKSGVPNRFYLFLIDFGNFKFGKIFLSVLESGSKQFKIDV